MSRFDSLIDDDEPVRRGRGRPKGSTTRPIEQRVEEDFPKEEKQVGIINDGLANIMNGVSVQTLCQLFKLGRGTAVRRLKECPIIGTRYNSTRMYDLATAARYLVDPVLNMEEFVRDMKPESLPERTRESFWNAKRKELLYRRDAGDLWPKAVIIEFLAETFKSFRKANQLWADTVEETTGLTEEQRLLIIDLADKALEEVKTSLNEQALNDKSYSYEKELDDEPETEI